MLPACQPQQCHANCRTRGRFATPPHSAHAPSPAHTAAENLTHACRQFPSARRATTCSHHPTPRLLLHSCLALQPTLSCGNGCQRTSIDDWCTCRYVGERLKNTHAHAQQATRRLATATSAVQRTRTCKFPPTPLLFAQQGTQSRQHNTAHARTRTRAHTLSEGKTSSVVCFEPQQSTAPHMHCTRRYCLCCAAVAVAIAAAEVRPPRQAKPRQATPCRCYCYSQPPPSSTRAGLRMRPAAAACPMK